MINYFNKNKSGFTLMELMIVIAIFGILTTIVIFKYGNFNNNIVMTNLAYEVALEVRQAQTFSLGVKQSGVTGGATDHEQFDNRFGVYFNLDENSGNSKKMVFFSDDNDNGQCDYDETTPCSVDSCSGDAGDECQYTLTLSRQIEFVRACYHNNQDPIDSDGDCKSGNPIKTVEITFARPEPEPIIFIDGVEQTGGNKGNVGIVLEAPGGTKKAVIIGKAGQIAVENIVD